MYCNTKYLKEVESVCRLDKIKRNQKILDDQNNVVGITLIINQNIIYLSMNVKQYREKHATTLLRGKYIDQQFLLIK